MARTPEAIKATMNRTLVGDEPGLVGYWNFDHDGAGDLSKNSNHGTLHGDAMIMESALPDTFIPATAVALEEKVINPRYQFPMNISIYLAAALHSFSVDVTFDPSVLQVLRVEEGPFLSGDGADATWWGKPEVDNKKGIITHIACRRARRSGTAADTGILATVMFKAIHAGESKVRLQNLRLLGPNGEEIASHGRAGSVNIYPHGKISGVIRAARSKTALPEAKIAVSKDGFTFGLSTYSDRLGRYTLNGVPVGHFGVAASRRLYTDATTEVNVKRGEITSNVDLEMTLVPLASAGGDASIGQPAPDFTLEDLDGNSVNLADFKGKLVILNFWASWSAPCRDQVTHLEALWKKYKGQGLIVIGVNNESDHASVKAFAVDKISYPVALDGWAAFEAYGVSEVPCICYIDKSGVVRYRDVGFGPGKEKEIERKIKELLH